MSRMLVSINSVEMAKVIMQSNPNEKYELVCNLLKQGKKVWLIVNETPIKQACTRLQKLITDNKIQVKEKDSLLVSDLVGKIFSVRDMVDVILSKSSHDYTYSPDAIVIERMESLSYNTYLTNLRKELAKFCNIFKCEIILYTKSFMNYYEAYTM